MECIQSSLITIQQTNKPTVITLSFPLPQHNLPRTHDKKTINPAQTQTT
jgi:hypothetical protein